MKMKIIGYSERGAMNALFYGIAHADDKEAMNKFLELAGITEEFSEFTLYNEFSLSEFGDPDLMIIAKNKNNEEVVVFFIEAKASCGERFVIYRQQEKHNGYMKDGTKYKDGHSSNLFFQLRLKNYFIQRLKDGTLNTEQESNDRLQSIKGRYRKIGNNVVVTKLVKLIQKCKKEYYYIAIIPAEKETVNTNSYGFETHTVSWKSIYDEPALKDYVKETLLFNQDVDENHRTVSQILNTPITEDNA